MKLLICQIYRYIYCYLFFIDSVVSYNCSKKYNSILSYYCYSLLKHVVSNIKDERKELIEVKVNNYESEYGKIIFKNMNFALLPSNINNVLNDETLLIKKDIVLSITLINEKYTIELKNILDEYMNIEMNKIKDVFEFNYLNELDNLHESKIKICGFKNGELITNVIDLDKCEDDSISTLYLL